MYSGLNREICQQAWRIILPAVQKAAADGVTNKRAGTILVLNPAVTAQDALESWRAHQDDEKLRSTFFTENAPLFKGHIGKEDDNFQYTWIAIAKAMVSVRTGLPSRQVQQEAPHLYFEGDTKLGGSVVRNGLVVAFSGIQAVFDEMIAGWMADTIIALCRNEMTKPEGVMASDSSYIGR